MASQQVQQSANDASSQQTSITANATHDQHEVVAQPESVSPTLDKMDAGKRTHDQFAITEDQAEDASADELSGSSSKRLKTDAPLVTTGNEEAVSSGNVEWPEGKSVKLLTWLQKNGAGNKTRLGEFKPKCFKEFSKEAGIPWKAASDQFTALERKFVAAKSTLRFWQDHFTLAENNELVAEDEEDWLDIDPEDAVMLRKRPFGATWPLLEVVCANSYPRGDLVYDPTSGKTTTGKTLPNFTSASTRNASAYMGAVKRKRNSVTPKKASESPFVLREEDFTAKGQAMATVSMVAETGLVEDAVLLKWESVLTRDEKEAEKFVALCRQDKCSAFNWLRKRAAELTS